MEETKLTIMRPIKSNRLTQGFKDSAACIEKFRGFYPLKVAKKINGVCPAGYTSLYEAMGMLGHNGEDWAAWNREPCFFPVEINGMTWKVINEIDNNGGKGVNVVTTKPVYLKMPDGHYESNYLKFRFWHLADSAVYDDKIINKGQLIGYCDSTGASTATHLHWDMKFCTLDSNALYKDNGYQGSIDFRPWFVNEFIKTSVPIKNNITNELNRLIFILKNKFIIN